MTSSIAYPMMFRMEGLAYSHTPRLSICTIMSSMVSVMRRRRSSFLLITSSLRFRSEMSRATVTKATDSPRSSFTGEVQTSAGNSEPSERRPVSSPFQEPDDGR